MPRISEEGRHLTVLNMFKTDTREKQDALLTEMRAIVDTADFPGWMSSTVHSGQNTPGTANFIQWRSREDLEVRYQGEKFRHATIPLFGEISTEMKLLQTYCEFTQRAPSLGDVIEISPSRDDLTVIEFFGVADEDQSSLVDALGPGQDYLKETPGYRSHAVLRGVGSRYYEGSFVVVYAQWDGPEAYDRFRNQPEAEQSDPRKKTQARLAELATLYEWNTYRVVHTRSAAQ